MNSTLSERRRLLPMPRIKWWLVEDETLILPKSNGEDEAFRLRIWRSKDQPAVVLVSQLEGHMQPYRMTVKVANAIYKGWLHYLPKGMYYYEYTKDATRLQFVDFVAFGHGDRQTLTDPSWHPVSFHTFRKFMGELIEL